MRVRVVASIAIALCCCLALSRPAAAHCDTVHGPVVTAARAALAAGDVALVLHWVRPEDEPAIRTAFQHTMEVRVLGPAAQELADRHFFETLVRIHRAGEGASFTGLTDEEPEPIIAATDRALERGSADELERQLIAAVRSGLHERFAAARDARAFRPGDVPGGRAFVAAYVPLTHWVEGILAAANRAGDHPASAGRPEEAHALSHRTGDGDRTEPSAPSRWFGAGTTLPWIAAALLAIAALVEGAFLVRRRRLAP